MKTSILVLFTSIIISVSVRAQSGFTFPGEWTKDFRVEVESKGGMLDQATKIRFTFDSCIYINRIGSKFERKSFLLTAGQRAELLAKLSHLKSDSIGTVSITYDKDTSSIVLFKGEDSFYASDDTDNESIRRDFHESYNYLVEFAMRKGKKKQ